MNKLIPLAATALVALAFLAGCNGATKAPPAGQPSGASAAGKPQVTCPLMGGKIDKTEFADHNGKRVYFCCPECVAKFKKDPEKYIKKLEAEGVTLAKAPAAEK